MSRVLVIEGSATEALRTRLILEAQGLDVQVASNAQAGLEAASNDEPDLIVMAAMMPSMTGYELWEQLKEREQAAGVPVLMLTSSHGPAEMAVENALKPENFLYKPCNPPELVGRILELLNPEPEVATAASAADAGEMAALKQQLQAAKDAKLEFLSTLSHELRTPLHEIMGMVELVLGSELPDQEQDYLEKAKESAEGLLARITDMIQWSEMQSGKVGLDAKRFDLYAVIGKTMAVTLPQAEEKGLDMDWDMDDEMPRYVVGDGQRLRQVLTNLLDNAVKFTESGDIMLTCKVVKTFARSVTLGFDVKDTGVGIAPEKQESIFGAFDMADSSLTRSRGGMGMGLAMANAIVGAMGGAITLESELGVGSTFGVTVDLELEVEEPAKKVIKLEELNILLAEDSPTNQLLARANLSKAGHQVQVANNGLEAVQAHTDGEFDLILMDVAMPEMDGLEATRTIRNNEKQTGGHTPIIAMTAFAMSDYREKCYDAGMDGYVTKPVGADELHAAIEDYLRKIAEQGVEAVEPPEEDLEPPVDLADALDTAGGDPELLEAVVEISLDECEKWMGEIDKAIAEGDAKHLEHAAHTLKGTMANVGSGPARDIAQKLETMGSDGTTVGGEAIARELEPEVMRLVEFYRSGAWKALLVQVEG